MLTLRRERRTGQAGITLIELLVSMIILGIVTTMLIAGWINLQRASAFAVSTNNARAAARDAMSRISSELRGAQPTSLPTTDTPTPPPPLTAAGKWQVTFYSSFNSADANGDGSGLTALRLTQLELDTGGSAAQKTLYWRKDTDNDGTFDRSMVLATNVVNTVVADVTNEPPSGGTSYTPVFRYAYIDAYGDVQWTDNADSSLVLASVVGVRVRLIIDKNMARLPNPVDITTTVRFRNASSD